ncbi:MAG: hypothetical protein ACKOW9_00545 [Candidatus Paceibacterota bacterium]
MRDRLSLLWLRVSLLPKGVAFLLVVALIGGGGAGYYFLSTSSSNKVAEAVRENSTSSNKAQETKPVNGNVNPTRPGLAEEPATPEQVESLVTQVSKESDAERAMKIATTQVRSNDALLFSCDDVLRKVGVALHKKFGTSAVVGEMDLCGYAVVIGILESVYADSGVSDASTKSVITACLSSPNLAGGCVGAAARGYAEKRNLATAIRICDDYINSKIADTEQGDIAYTCAWGASATESIKFDKKMSIDSCLKSKGRVLEGCLSAFGGRYLGVETTLEECKRFKDSAYAACVYGFSLIVAFPPKGVEIGDVIYRQCAVAQGCAKSTATLLKDSGRSRDQIFAFCKKYESAVARNECESVVRS